MNEHEFLLTLQKRAKEQEHIMKGMLLPSVFANISIWLGNHPWRILIPIAFLLSLLFRGLLGQEYTDLILGIFRKL